MNTLFNLSPNGLTWACFDPTLRIRARYEPHIRSGARVLRSDLPKPWYCPNESHHAKGKTLRDHRQAQPPYAL